MSMRPYLTQQSYRPHCPCCSTKQGHGHPGNSEATKRAQRAGRKAMRRLLKKECRNVD